MVAQLFVRSLLHIVSLVSYHADEEASQKLKAVIQAEAFALPEHAAPTHDGSITSHRQQHMELYGREDNYPDNAESATQAYVPVTQPSLPAGDGAEATPLPPNTHQIAASGQTVAEQQQHQLDALQLQLAELQHSVVLLMAESAYWRDKYHEHMTS